MSISRFLKINQLLKLYTLKEKFLVSLCQIINASTELFFFVILWCHFSKYHFFKRISILNFNVDFKTQLFILVIICLIKLLIGYFSLLKTGAIVFNKWDKVSKDSYSKIRNGLINKNNMSSFLNSVIQDTDNGLSGFYFNFFILTGEVFIAVIGLIILSIFNVYATIYSIILTFIFYLLFFGKALNNQSKLGTIRRDNMFGLINKLRTQIVYRDNYWLNNKEESSKYKTLDVADKLSKLSTNHQSTQIFNRITLEIFGLLLIISFTILSNYISGSQSDSSNILIALAIWLKLFTTFIKISSYYQQICYSMPMAVSLYQRIINEGINDNQYIKLDSFKSQNKIKKEKSLLEIKEHIIDNQKGLRYKIPNIKIFKGNNYILLGESGCGKTTLIQTVLGLPSKFNFRSKAIFKLTTNKIAYMSNEHELEFGQIKDFFDFDTKNFNYKLCQNLINKFSLKGRIPNIKKHLKK